MRVFDLADRRARLARRHHLAPGARAPDVESAAGALIGLHATDPATVYLSAWARVDGMSSADLDRALYVDRSLVKHLAMRRTLFVFPERSLPAVQAAASARVADSESRRLIRDVEGAGLFEDGKHWLDRASAAVLATLSGGRQATSSELRAEIPALQGAIMYGEGRSWGGAAPIGPRVLTTLSAKGLIVRATNQGGWNVSRPRWAATESWLGHPIADLDPAEARAALVRHWLFSFGPGSVQDIKWWLGSMLGAVRAALVDVGAVEVDLHGQPGYLLPDDLEPVRPVEPWAALLPGLDPTTMGWFDRAWYLGEHRGDVFDSTGNAGPTAWWDGRIVGGWHQTDRCEVVLDLLEKVDAHATRTLEERAGRLTDWLVQTRVTPRFPSPLSRSGTRPRGG